MDERYDNRLVSTEGCGPLRHVYAYMMFISACKKVLLRLLKSGAQDLPGLKGESPFCSYMSSILYRNNCLDYNACVLCISNKQERLRVSLINPSKLLRFISICEGIPRI